MILILFQLKSFSKPPAVVLTVFKALFVMFKKKVPEKVIAIQVFFNKNKMYIKYKGNLNE